jgi:hypothetical protein
MKNVNGKIVCNSKDELVVTSNTSNVSCTIPIANELSVDPLNSEIDITDYSKLAAMEYEKISKINTLEEYLDYKLDLLKTKDINMVLFELTRIERIVDNNKVLIDFLKDQCARCNEDLYHILDQYKDRLIDLLDQKCRKFSCINQMED